MAVAYKVLGQKAGTTAVGTYTTLGSPGAGKSWLVSTISICNQAASAMTYRLAIAANANASSPLTAEFIVYGSSVPANDTVTLTLGITLENGYSIVASSSANTSSFSVFGTEIS
jgi:hypothetical protein